MYEGRVEDIFSANAATPSKFAGPSASLRKKLARESSLQCRGRSVSRGGTYCPPIICPMSFMYLLRLVEQNRPIIFWQCIRRESNPELGHGKTQCYRYTTNALLALHKQAPYLEKLWQLCTYTCS